MASLDLSLVAKGSSDARIFECRYPEGGQLRFRWRVRPSQQPTVSCLSIEDATIESGYAFPAADKFRSFFFRQDSEACVDSADGTYGSGVSILTNKDAANYWVYEVTVTLPTPTSGVIRIRIDPCWSNSPAGTLADTAENTAAKGEVFIRDYTESKLPTVVEPIRFFGRRNGWYPATAATQVLTGFSTNEYDPDAVWNGQTFTAPVDGNVFMRWDGNLIFTTAPSDGAITLQIRNNTLGFDYCDTDIKNLVNGSQQAVAFTGFCAVSAGDAVYLRITNVDGTPSYEFNGSIEGLFIPS